jgi:hypothetical protein
MGVMIYPRRVIDRANVTDRELDRLAEHVRGIRTSLGMLGNVGRLSLKGQAWDSARSYVAEVELPYLNSKLQWIEAMKNGNARFRSEAQRLPGVNCLDKDLLEEEFDYWEDRLDREYDREHPRSSVISRCRRMMRDINSKLVAIDVFVQATGGIYDRATGIQNVLDRVDTEIKKVSYNTQTNEIQFTSISAICLKGLEQVDVMEAVKVTGLSEEQIREAMKYGFTIQEVCSAWSAVQNSKKKKWRHDVVELLYVAGKAEKLEPVDWKEVVHNSREDMEEIYEWVKHGREDELIRQWLSLGYKMSSAEVSIAKGMMNEFWGKGSGREGIFSDNPNYEEIAKRNLMEEGKEVWNRYSDLLKLKNKTNVVQGIGLHALAAIPLFERISNWGEVKLAGMYGMGEDTAGNISEYLSYSKDQFGNWTFAGTAIGSVISYSALSSAVLNIPVVGQGIAKGGEILSKVPVLSKIPVVNLKNILAGWIGGVSFQTVPGTISDIADGKSTKEVAKNTVLSIGEEGAWSIAGEGILFGLKAVVEKVKVIIAPYADDYIKEIGAYEGGSREIVKEIDEVVGNVDDIIEGTGKTKYDNVKFDSLSGDDLTKITTDIRNNGGSPINIPENTKVIAQSKNGYQQIKYKWNDGSYSYEARWHTETPGAVQYDRGTTWVVTKTTPGNANGVQKVVEVKVGDSWVNEPSWNQAVKANQAGTATEAQKQMLQNGHYQAK